MGYADAHKMLLVCEIILGQKGVDHTEPYSDYVVVKHTSHELPLCIVEFK
jgi:hypothetical protein